jgi:hypothetical protein
LDKDGRPLLNSDGHKIRSRKAGTPKKPSEYTPEERRTIEDQQRIYKLRERARASAVLGEIKKAEEVLGQN